MKCAGAVYGHNVAVSEPNFLKWFLNTLLLFFLTLLSLMRCGNGFLRGRHLEVRTWTGREVRLEPGIVISVIRLFDEEKNQHM